MRERKVEVREQVHARLVVHVRVDAFHVLRECTNKTLHLQTVDVDLVHIVALDRVDKQLDVVLSEAERTQRLPLNVDLEANVVQRRLLAIASECITKRATVVHSLFWRAKRQRVVRKHLGRIVQRACIAEADDAVEIFVARA